MFLVLLVNALFAVVFTLSKIALAYGAPYFTTALRMLMGGMVITIGLKLLGKDLPRLKDRWVIHDVLLLAIFNIFLANGLEFWGLQYVNPSKACFIYNLSPLFSSVFSYVYFDERMTYKKFFGLLIAFIGFAPILAHGNAVEASLFHIGFLSSAELAIMGATIATVYGWVIMQDVMRRSRGHPHMANGLSMLVGGCIALAVSAATESWNPVPVIAWAPLLGMTALIALISNIFCFSLYIELLKKYTANFMALSSLTGPLFAALSDWIFLGITVTWHFWLAMTMVSCGMVLYYREETRQGYMR